MYQPVLEITSDTPKIGGISFYVITDNAFVWASDIISSILSISSLDQQHADVSLPGEGHGVVDAVSEGQLLCCVPLSYHAFHQRTEVGRYRSQHLLHQLRLPLKHKSFTTYKTFYSKVQSKFRWYRGTYSEIIFIRWTFIFMYFVGKVIHKLKIKKNI